MVEVGGDKVGLLRMREIEVGVVSLIGVEFGVIRLRAVEVGVVMKGKRPVWSEWKYYRSRPPMITGLRLRCRGLSVNIMNVSQMSNEACVQAESPYGHHTRYCLSAVITPDICLS